MFRAVAGHEELRANFDLRVGYNGSMVNRHGIELFLVGADLELFRTWSRTNWQPDEVASAAAAVS
jgi:hypothetical protein